MKEHDTSHRAVMNRIRNYNLKLSSEKCEYRKIHVTYLGHVLTPRGIQPDTEIIYIQYLGKFLSNLS